MKFMPMMALTAGGVIACACGKREQKVVDPGPPLEGETSFAEDLGFLQTHTAIHVLKDESSGARVAVAPAWQGRVMTSSATGDRGASLGWLHRENIKTGILPPGQRTGLARHIHIFGGEERFWLGPEGGQFALFFPPAPMPYTFENWTTPALIDTEPFEVVASNERFIELKKNASIINRAGTDLQLGILRRVDLLEHPAISRLLESPIPAGVRTVAYRSTNTLTNNGLEAWTREDGLVSIWMLGMFPHGPDVTMVLPLKEGPGLAVNTDYFGPLEADRLVSGQKAVFFKGDGAFRSKVGVPPGRSTGVAGSYDAGRGRLTIVHCEVPPDAAKLPYVRSQWEDHQDPYAGDLINAYNDGPPSPGEAPLGPFYELETSSPALPLRPGESMTHVQTTMHFQGDATALDPIAQTMLGVSLEEIIAVFRKP